MRENKTKAKLNAGQPVFGAFCNLSAIPMVEMMAYLGFDFVIIDGEHGPLDLETSEHMVRACEASGITPIARVAMNHQQAILRYLDMGCQGVDIPMVNTAEQAKAVADACRYPPIGRRGLAGVRAAEWGLTGPLGEYTRTANREVLCAVQVETIQAMENVQEILAVPEVDMVFVGPTDMSSALGHPGEPTHPEVMRVLESLGKAVRAGGKHAGTIANSAGAARTLGGWGYNFFATGVGTMFVNGARAYITEARKAMG